MPPLIGRCLLMFPGARRRQRQRFALAVAFVGLEATLHNLGRQIAGAEI